MPVENCRFVSSPGLCPEWLSPFLRFLLSAVCVLLSQCLCFRPARKTKRKMIAYKVSAEALLHKSSWLNLPSKVIKCLDKALAWEDKELAEISTRKSSFK